MIDQVDKHDRELNVALTQPYGRSGDLNNWGTHEVNEIIATEISQLLLQNNFLPKPEQGKRFMLFPPLQIEV